MNFLRRLIGVIFALTIAFGAGLIFLPLAVVADPVTRAAAFVFIQMALSDLNPDIAPGEESGGLDLLGDLAWAVVVTVSAMPVTVVGLIGELARVRTFYWYAGGTAVVAAASPWLIRLGLNLPRAGQYNSAELRFALVFFFGGLLSGSVYWLLAGRRAGLYLR
ncbi:MAG TPA: hypothetical protein VME69_02295 [Methylocella sp.]|nr:hypothetical protein [Methylocella sp.]